MDVTENIIIGSWYDESESYDFSKPRYSESTQHFTQLIWRNTKKIGYATLKMGDKIVFVVIYYPKGNIENEYGINVKPFLKELPKDEKNAEEELVKNSYIDFKYKRPSSNRT